MGRCPGQFIYFFLNLYIYIFHNYLLVCVCLNVIFGGFCLMVDDEYVFESDFTINLLIIGLSWHSCLLICRCLRSSCV